MAAYSSNGDMMQIPVKGSDNSCRERTLWYVYTTTYPPLTNNTVLIPTFNPAKFTMQMEQFDVGGHRAAAEVAFLLSHTIVSFRCSLGQAFFERVELHQTFFTFSNNPIVSNYLAHAFMTAKSIIKSQGYARMEIQIFSASDATKVTERWCVGIVMSTSPPDELFKELHDKMVSFENLSSELPNLNTQSFRVCFSSHHAMRLPSRCVDFINAPLSALEAMNPLQDAAITDDTGKYLIDETDFECKQELLSLSYLKIWAMSRSMDKDDNT